MDITSLIIVVSLAAIMLYLIVRLPLTIFGNLRAGHRFRQGLAKVLDELRLSRMLRHLGIDREQYLHEQTGLTIRRHMNRCNNCEDKEKCDQALAEDKPADVDALGFCNNIDDLKNLSKR